ncbi:pantothenate kinase [Ranunculus cassubicifolius]
MAIESNFQLKDQNISHLALDIGGSLIKLVYFSTVNNGEKKSSEIKELEIDSGEKSVRILGGNLHFVMFQTTEIKECLDFIYQLQCVDCNKSIIKTENIMSNTKVTGGGAYKFANMFKDRLGVSIEKEDEMNSLVAGANFVLKGIEKEAFTHNNGQMNFVSVDGNDLYPYLLVNIGSGVSIIKVDGDGKYERVGGSSIGGGTFVGLGKYLTKLDSFDELLEASLRGDNKNVDMLVGDIYGGKDYAKIGLSASTIASSFGKVKNKELDDCKPEDLALSLLRMISYHIGQLAHSKACEYGLKRIFFGGFFIRGHAYTMDTISYAVQYWSKGGIEAMFLRHEGFLGAIGSLMSNKTFGHRDLKTQHSVEHGSSSDPCVNEKLHGSPQGDLNDKASILGRLNIKFFKVGFYV